MASVSQIIAMLEKMPPDAEVAVYSPIPCDEIILDTICGIENDFGYVIFTRDKRVKASPKITY